MKNQNTFRPVAKHIEGWASREVIYHCPQCDASFRLLKHQEKFCHNCGIALDWTNLPTHLSQQMNDLISRQDVLDVINDLPDCRNGYSDTYDKAQIIGVLEGLPSANQWIPVSEKLPDVNGDYLITWKFASKKGPFITIAEWDFDEWIFDDYMDFYPRYNIEVLAWIPLPSAYDEQ